ncbi:MAG: restriction endonuclease subunit S [Betaproteobacteria bacterium]|nr:restriction endonuclease subunit S [Betaproteobacteria bacterium]
MFDRYFDYSGLAFVSDEQADGLRGVVLQPRDILLNITGDGITFGRACIVPNDVLPACVNQHVSIIRLDPQRADPGYVLSFLSHPGVKSYIESFNAGGSRRAITKGHIESFRLPLPPLDEQRAIAHILGTLDDKIELNRRMNETLEAMARALFKSWFVDFDPVRAKAEGRDPGLPKPLADLFPDSFEDSELGEIPKGWRAGTLADLALLNPESWSKETRPEIINYVDLSNTKWGSIESVTCYTQGDAPSRAQRVLRPGDSIVGTVRPGNGSYAFISADGLTGSTGFAVLRPCIPEYAQFVYLGATASKNIETLAHLADGGAYPAVRPDVVIATEVIRPSDKVLARFSMLCAPLLEEIARNERESHTLAALRDTLLPKLMSGELRIRDAEELLEKTS